MQKAFDLGINMFDVSVCSGRGFIGYGRRLPHMVSAGQAAAYMALCF